MPGQFPGSGNRINHTRTALKKYKQGPQDIGGKREAYKHPRAVYVNMRKRYQLRAGSENPHRVKYPAQSVPVRSPSGVAGVIAGYTNKEYCILNPCAKHCLMSCGNQGFIFTDCKYQSPNDHFLVNIHEKMWRSLIIAICLYIPITTTCTTTRARLTQPLALG